MLWYLPVSPWSWSYTFACMISVRSNRGRHKLVSEPTACRNPLSNSLAEVESSRWKTFTNMAVWPMGPRRHREVLGSFIPRPLLWDSEPSSIRVKRFLLKTNFRFSKILSPGEPLQSRWSPTAPEDFGDTLWYSLETLCPSLLLFPTTDKSLWITTYTCHSYDHSPLFLLLQDTRSFLYCSENTSCLLPSSSLPHEYPFK